jgi:hypothetical protein
MTLKPTTVRFVPGEATSPDELAIAVLHLYAYETAKGLVSPRARVLDIGFGEGYGSEILPTPAPSIGASRSTSRSSSMHERATVLASRHTTGRRSPRRTNRLTSSSRFR